MHADLLSQETNHFGRVRPVGRTQTAVLCFRAAIQVAFAKNVGYAGWASELRPSLQQFGASNALHAVTVAERTESRRWGTGNTWIPEVGY